jgi:hypothetical protein
VATKAGGNVKLVCSDGVPELLKPAYAWLICEPEHPDALAAVPLGGTSQDSAGVESAGQEPIGKTAAKVEIGRVAFTVAVVVLPTVLVLNERLLPCAKLIVVPAAVVPSN